MTPCTEITVQKIYILICCCYCFKIFFCVFNSFFLWGWLHRNIIFNLGEMNFSVSSPGPTEKKTCVFLCVYFFFLCGLTQRKISFNMGENNFSMRVRPTEKLFLTVNSQKIFYFSVIIFLWVFFWGYTIRKIFFWWYSYFSVCFRTHRKKWDSSSVKGIVVVAMVG